MRAIIRAGKWVRMRNRNDTLSFSPDRTGARCDWGNTRPLHLCTVFPVTGRWLLRRALQSCPVQMQDYPDTVSERRVCRNGVQPTDDLPEVSFLIGHRGTDRLPHLLATLRSLAAQENSSFECIVVEQDETPVVRDQLPAWVNYVHTPPPKAGMLYNRSLAFNEAARRARGEVLILHDNDMLVPVCYAEKSVRSHQDGYEVAQLKRFIFYLDRVSSQHMTGLGNGRNERVIENLCGGGSIAISRSVYWDLGGMDEDFIGWGGEDEEFWDRCLTRKVWEFGCLPVIHLWHEAQSGKRAANGQGAHTAELTALRRAIPPEQRIAELTARREGASQ
jgi:hypothetical protein